jgi:hypothetical protein
MLKAFKRKVFSFFIAYVGKYFLRLILSTCKIEIHGFDEFKKLASEEKCILMLWHNRLSIVSEILNRLDNNTIFAAFISKSKDGDPLAVLANSYKNGKAIRVAHDRKHQALITVIETLKTSHEVVIITPDGPRGPRYEVKPGIIVAAQETNAVIVPFTFISSKFWQLKSWDRLIFPKPFSKIIVTFGDAVRIKDPSLHENQVKLREILLNIEKEVNISLFDNESNWPK